MPKDLFCESSFIIQGTLGNKLIATTLANTCATGYGFIDKEFAETVCQILEIKPQCLIKLKQIQRFDGKYDDLARDQIRGPRIRNTRKL